MEVYWFERLAEWLGDALRRHGEAECPPVMVWNTDTFRVVDFKRTFADLDDHNMSAIGSTIKIKRLGEN
jgi:hypothetical protein